MTANDPAFSTLIKRLEDPRTGKHYDKTIGLSKREYFAAMALKGLAGAYGAPQNVNCQLMAEAAVRYADAMLAELQKERT